jgi:hypothetical protein
MNTLRPDERSSQSRIEKSHELNKSIKKTGSTVLSLAAGVTGAGIASKILPFLSEYISADTALKGISQLSPKLGDFLNRGMAQGLSLKDGLEFIKEKISPENQERIDKSEDIIADMKSKLAGLDNPQNPQQQRSVFNQNKPQQTQTQFPQGGGNADAQLMAMLQKVSLVLKGS